MESNEPQVEDKGHLVRNILIGAAILFVVVAVATGTPGAVEQANKSAQTTEEKQKPAEPAKEETPATPPVRTVWDDGTYEVGKDIALGKYISTSDNCYWQISNDTNGQDIVVNGMQSGQQIVELSTPGQYFTVQRCSFKLAS